MKNRLNRLLYGKNSKPLYFVRNVVRYLTPKRLTQARLAGVLAELERRPAAVFPDRRALSAPDRRPFRRAIRRFVDPVACCGALHGGGAMSAGRGTKRNRVGISSDAVFSAQDNI